MIEDTLLLVLGVTLILFGLEIFLTPDRRKFANQMIKAATLVIAGLYILYYFQTNLSLPVGGGNKYGY